MNGEVYEHIETFVSEKLQSQFGLPNNIKHQICIVASKIRIKYRQSSHAEERFLLIMRFD